MCDGACRCGCAAFSRHPSFRLPRQLNDQFGPVTPDGVGRRRLTYRLSIDRLKMIDASSRYTQLHAIHC
jgi:hypothetical protein